MKSPLIALMFSAGDAPQAETLLDWIYQLAGKVPHQNPLLLVASSNVHPEMQTKVKLAGEMAFSHVELVVANATDIDDVMSANRLFRATAQTVMSHYRSPWLLLEPKSVPLKASWIEHLILAYDSQPKRFMGSRLKFQVRDEEKMCIGKIAVYPNNAATDLSGYCDSIVPFNQLAGDFLVPRATKTLLIQHADINGEEDFGKVRPDAVLLHSDKTGAYLRHLRDTVAVAAPDGVSVQLPPVLVEEASPKIDGRSKAARQAKAALTT